MTAACKWCGWTEAIEKGECWNHMMCRDRLKQQRDEALARVTLVERWLANEQDKREPLENERDEARAALRLCVPHVRHLESCALVQFPLSSRSCDCGRSAALAAARKALGEQ